MYLRYNTGLHVSQNGRELAAQLEQLVAHWPVPVTALTLVGYSMGGLVARSAIHYGQAGAMRWAGQLGDLVCLATPHHGSPLERAGNLLDALLGVNPYSAPYGKLIQLRSAGITDLRYGHVYDVLPCRRRRLPSTARWPIAWSEMAWCHCTAPSGSMTMRGIHWAFPKRPSA